MGSFGNTDKNMERKKDPKSHRLTYNRELSKNNKKDKKKKEHKSHLA